MPTPARSERGLPAYRPRNARVRRECIRHIKRRNFKSRIPFEHIMGWERELPTANERLAKALQGNGLHPHCEVHWSPVQLFMPTGLATYRPAILLVSALLTSMQRAHALPFRQRSNF